MTDSLLKKIGDCIAVARALERSPLPRARLTFDLLALMARKKLFGRKPVRMSITLAHVRRKIYLRDMADIAVFKEVFVAREYVTPLTSVPRTIVDIGAHIGAASLFFSAEYPDAAITAYEPDPDNYALLVQNTKGLPITCVQAAVSDTAGRAALYKGESSIGSSLRRRDDRERKILVPCVALPDVLESRPDIVKFDVEGEEYRMFSNVKEIPVEALVGEVHYDLMEATREEFTALFPDFRMEELRISKNRSIVYLHRTERRPML